MTRSFRVLLSCATNGSSSSFGIRCGAVVRGERATKCFPHLVPSWFVCSNLTRVQYNIGCSAQLTLLGEFPFPKLNVNRDPLCMRALSSPSRLGPRDKAKVTLTVAAPDIARNPNAIYIPVALCVVARECLCKYLAHSPSSLVLQEIEGPPSSPMRLFVFMSFLRMIR